MNLLLFERGELKTDGYTIELQNKDPRSVHLRTILKASEESVFDAGIIDGEMGKARICSITAAGLQIEFSPEKESPELYPLVLLMGLARPPTVKKVLKEATALGVKEFILCGTDTGERSYRSSSVLKPESIKETLIEGAQQAVCTRLPAVTIEHSLRCALEHFYPPEPGQEYRLIGLDNYEAELSLTDFWKLQTDSGSSSVQKTTVLAVGSERGWTDRERIRLRESGFTLASLGSRVLRTETASIAGLSVCLSGMGLI